MQRQRCPRAASVCGRPHVVHVRAVSDAAGKLFAGWALPHILLHAAVAELHERVPTGQIERALADRDGVELARRPHVAHAKARARDGVELARAVALALVVGLALEHARASLVHETGLRHHAAGRHELPGRARIAAAPHVVLERAAAGLRAQILLALDVRVTAEDKHARLLARLARVRIAEAERRDRVAMAFGPGRGLEHHGVRVASAAHLRPVRGQTGARKRGKERTHDGSRSRH